jgi:hypothetical protein
MNFHGAEAGIECRKIVSYEPSMSLALPLKTKGA